MAPSRITKKVNATVDKSRQSKLTVVRRESSEQTGVAKNAVSHADVEPNASETSEARFSTRRSATHAPATIFVGFDDSPSRRFVVDENSVVRLTQYHHLYHRRLNQLTPRLRDRIREVDVLGKVGSIEDLTVSAGAVVFRQKDGKTHVSTSNANGTHKRRSNDPEAMSEEYWVIGNLFKVMPNRPSILRDVAKAENIDLQPADNRYLTPADQLWLEDAFQKVQLGDVDIDRYMCGQTVAVFGRLDGKGLLHVNRILEPGTPISAVEKPLELENTKLTGARSASSAATYVIFVCGFGLFGMKQFDANDEGQLENEKKFRDRVAALSAFFGALNGINFDEESREIFDSSYAVIVAGNMTCYPRPGYRNELHHMAPYLMQKLELVSTRGIHAADKLLSTITDRMPFAVMPGAEDATFYLFPQQPLSYALFARECAQKKPLNLRLCTNPYEFYCLGRHFLGTSGQNVSDALKNCTSHDDPVAMLRYMLQCGHMAPTAPNTLATFTDPTSDDKDPFVINQVPDVFFAGNQPEFAAKLVDCDGCDVLDASESNDKNASNRAHMKKCLLLSLPKFGESGGCVVAVNTKDLSAKPLFFRTKSAVAVDTAESIAI